MQNVFKSTLQHFVTSALFVIFLFSSASFAAPLKVGTYLCPPFVIHSTGEELKLAKSTLAFPAYRSRQSESYLPIFLTPFMKHTLPSRLSVKVTYIP